MYFQSALLVSDFYPGKPTVMGLLMNAVYFLIFDYFDIHKDTKRNVDIRTNFALPLGVFYDNICSEKNEYD